MGVKNAEKSVKFVREKRFTPVKKNKNRVKNGVHAQIGGSRPKKKTLDDTRCNERDPSGGLGGAEGGSPPNVSTPFLPG